MNRFTLTIAAAATALTFAGQAFAGDQYVDETGFAVSGYDVVAYFNLPQNPVGEAQRQALPKRNPRRMFRTRRIGIARRLTGRGPAGIRQRLGLKAPVLLEFIGPAAGLGAPEIEPGAAARARIDRRSGIVIGR